MSDLKTALLKSLILPPRKLKTKKRVGLFLQESGHSLGIRNGR